MMLTSDDKFSLRAGVYSLLDRGSIDASLYSLMIARSLLSVIPVIAVFLSRCDVTGVLIRSPALANKSRLFLYDLKLG
jgi:hypothetical protein